MNTSDFTAIIHNYIDINRKSDTCFSKCVIIYTIYSYTYKQMLKHSLNNELVAYIKKLEESIDKYITHIPSLVIYQNRFVSLEDNKKIMENNEYYTLYSLYSLKDYSFENICKLIDICPFTIFCIDKPSINIIDYAVIAFNNPLYKEKMGINKVITVDIILSLRKIICCNKFINYNENIVKYTDEINNVTTYIDTIPNIIHYIQKKYNNIQIIKNNNIYKVYQDDTKMYDFVNYTIIKKILIATYEIY